MGPSGFVCASVGKPRCARIFFTIRSWSITAIELRQPPGLWQGR
jgi:hypothetical protein